MILICNSGKTYFKDVSTLLKYMHKSMHMSMKSLLIEVALYTQVDYG